MNQSEKSSHGQIIKSSALIGGSTVINVFLRMVRNKVMALLLDTSGLGLFGNFDRTSDLVRTIAGMGINVSGVRQIAEAVGTQDEERIARTITSLRRVAVLTGALGALLLLVFCRQVSWIMFKDTDHAKAVALLALAVFFADVSAGQTALVQGMRRISDLAKLSVWGAVYATLFSIPIIYFYGESGVVPSMVCAAGMTILTSWWDARTVKVKTAVLSWRELKGEASGLLRLGVVFMASGFLQMVGPFVVQAILTRRLGLSAAGLYQSAFAVGGVYLGYVLQAMAADFYPRLSGIAKDNSACNRLVNEQVEVGLLVAGPGVLATLALAPLMIRVFYSEKFGDAENVLRWICLGMLLRVASWPLGFLLMAKGERKIYFWTEFGSTAAYIGLIWACVHQWGLTGAGIAFFGSYIAYTVGICVIARSLTGFKWSPANLRLAALFIPLIAAVFVGWYFLPPLAIAIGGALAALVTGGFSLRTICTLIPLQRLPRAAQRLLALFRLAPVANGV